MKGKELDPALAELFINYHKTFSKDTILLHGDNIVTTDKNVANTLTLQGDLSIAGVNEQMPLLIRHLTEKTTAPRDEDDRKLQYDIDLSGVQVLDTCGCQLLAVLLDKLRTQGAETVTFNLSDTHRQQIHLLGFDEAIFTGEYV